MTPIPNESTEFVERDLVVDTAPILGDILQSAKVGSGSLVLLIPQYLYPEGGTVVTVEVRRMV